MVPVIAGKVAPDSLGYINATSSVLELDVSSFRYERITNAEGLVEGKVLYQRDRERARRSTRGHQARRHLGKHSGILRQRGDLLVKHRSVAEAVREAIQRRRSMRAPGSISDRSPAQPESPQHTAYGP